jgi:ankyrin repeat protein
VRNNQLGLHKVRDLFGRSPVHIAASGGSHIALYVTFDCLGDEDRTNTLNLPGRDGMTALHLAAKAGSIQCVRNIIDKGQAQSLTHQDIWGREAIHLAASHGHDEIASRLLREGSQLSWTDKIGKTPLDYLLKGDQSIKRNLDATTKQNEGQVQNPQNSNNDQVPKTDTTLHHEQAEAQTRTDSKRKIFIEFALRRPEYRDKEGKTFLHRAAEYTDIDIILQLLQEGYKLEARDSKGRTALHSAIQASQTQTVLHLLQGVGGYLANPLAMDEEKVTTLMFAAGKGLLDVVEYLLGSNIVVTQDSDQNAAALQQHNPEESIEENKTQFKRPKVPLCDPLASDSLGRTALHIALSNAKSEIAP